MAQIKFHIPFNLYKLYKTNIKPFFIILIMFITTTNCGKTNQLTNAVSLEQHNSDQLSPSEKSKRQKGQGAPGGIPNLGGTCYMNSALQVLKAFYLPKINEKHDELGNSLQALMQVIANDHEAASQLEAKTVFNALNSTFGWTTDASAQQDAIELIELFFAWMNLPKANTQYVKRKAGEEEQQNHDEWLVLKIGMSEIGANNNSTMQDYFDNLLKPEEMISKFKENDKKESTFQIVPKLANLSNLYQGMLVLQMKRFATKGGMLLENGKHRANDYEKYKLNNSIQKPMTLSVKADQTIHNTETQNYELVGFIEQMGSISGGHYVAYVKNNGVWICYNDSSVNSITPEEAEENAKQAYLFFYQPECPRRQS